MKNFARTVLLAVVALFGLLVVGCWQQVPPGAQPTTLTPSPATQAGASPASVAQPAAPSIDFVDIDQGLAFVLKAWQLYSPALPLEDQTIGALPAAALQSTLTRVAADRANGLPDNQPDLDALQPLAQQLAPLIAKATVIKATTATPAVKPTAAQSPSPPAAGK